MSDANKWLNVQYQVIKLPNWSVNKNKSAAKYDVKCSKNKHIVVSKQEAVYSWFGT